MMRSIAVAICSIALCAFVGCTKEQPKSPTTSDGHSHDDHSHDDGHDHSGDTASAHDHGHGGPVIELGTATIGPFTVRAARDQGEVKAGSDVPIDVWLSGSEAKVIAVRFWIGTETGTESVKAKAEIEVPTEPNHWHTHAEVPNPMPAISELWVEIEIEGQDKQVGAFDLKIS